MRGWLKLVGSSEWLLTEHWFRDRPELLRQIRFSELHPPDPVSRSDRLVYHAVGHRRLIAVVEVLDDEPKLDPAPTEWERQWPLILPVRPLIKVGRVSAGPATDSLGEIYDVRHQGFVPLTDDQLQHAEQLLRNAGGA